MESERVIGKPCGELEIEAVDKGVVAYLLDKVGELPEHGLESMGSTLTVVDFEPYIHNENGCDGVAYRSICSKKLTH